MKLGTVIDDATYERELAKRVRQYEQRCRFIRQPKASSLHQIHRIIDIFRGSVEPLNYRQVMARFGASETAAGRFYFRSRLTYLEKQGWIERAGSYVDHGHTGTLFRSTSTDSASREWRLGLATEEFLRRVDNLNARRIRRVCLATHVFVPVGINSKRNYEIVEARTRGLTQQAIANQYGITREWVRRIVVGAVKNEVPR